MTSSTLKSKKEKEGKEMKELKAKIDELECEVEERDDTITDLRNSIEEAIKCFDNIADDTEKTLRYIEKHIE